MKERFYKGHASDFLTLNTDLYCLFYSHGGITVKYDMAVKIEYLLFSRGR